MGIGNPKTAEAQEAEKAAQVDAVRKQYETSTARRLSPESKSADSGERRMAGVGDSTELPQGKVQEQKKASTRASGAKKAAKK